MVDADLVVLLTDVDGLFSADPRREPNARRIGEVPRITPELLRAAGGAGERFATGGMRSKLEAARIATTGGVAMAIVDGRDPKRLRALFAGEDVGTFFPAHVDRQARRKHWIAHVLQPRGRLVIDAGAWRAIAERGASLLPVGVRAVEGVFDKGECVEIVHDGRVVARGLVNYNAEEARRIIGLPSRRIAEVLGYADFSSLVHRDNLVLLKEAE
ncbi:MAG: glutamate 5-kinase [Zetaproteobacteria bacterium]|nr:MAG: glutamate 5-kinase [Zetaproteobacteria bacterium]